MSKEKRDALESILSDRFTPPPPGGNAATQEPVEAQEEAMFAWLMVQSARLRVLSPSANGQIRDNALIQMEAGGASSDAGMIFNDPRAQQARRDAAAPFNNAHEASDRPEYATALNNLLRYLDPSEPLHPRVRTLMKPAFDKWREQGRISPLVDAMVGRGSIDGFAREGYRLDDTGAFRSAAARTDDVAQRVPVAPPEELLHSGPASSRQGEGLARSDSSLSQQSQASAQGRAELAGMRRIRDR